MAGLTGPHGLGYWVERADRSGVGLSAAHFKIMHLLWLHLLWTAVQ